MERKEKIENERQENEILIKENGDSIETKGRKYTISIAIPSSMISKVQSKELKTYVCGQVRYLFSRKSFD